ncbi:unnamed protein product [Toxocara canis]|uniref:Brain protein I3 n=1 Tax=Toxocara canis TaxID=6265 RepID=A0A183UNW9_TOXCA|nr:unnamed protein product [Toxocara canis]
MLALIALVTGYVVEDRRKCPLCKSTSIKTTRASADLCLAILLSTFCFPCGLLSCLWVSKVRYCEVCGAEF